MRLEDFPTNDTITLDDWGSTFGYGADYIDHRDAGMPSTPSERRATIEDVAEVVAWEGSTNEPGGGTELDLTAVLRLRDGSYLGLHAWNDYTGWGCQDGVEFMYAATLAELVPALTDEARRTLDLGGES